MRAIVVAVLAAVACIAASPAIAQQQVPAVPEVPTTQPNNQPDNLPDRVPDGLPDSAPDTVPDSLPDATPPATDDRPPPPASDALETTTISDLMEVASDHRLLLLLAASALVIGMLWAGDVIRPGSAARNGLRKADELPPILWLFAASVVFAAIPVATYFAAEEGWLQDFGQQSQATESGEPAQIDPGLRDLQRESTPLLIGWTIGCTVAFGMVLLIAKGAKDAGLKAHWTDWPLGVGLFILALPLILLSSDLAIMAHEAATKNPVPDGSVEHPLLQQILDYRDSPWAWALIAGVVLAVPIVEEVAFRVFLQSAIISATKMPWLGIVVSALAFGALHLGNGKWYAAIPVTMLGICCGVAYERCKHVSVPIAMHACFNAFNIGLAMYMTSSGDATS
ncbi:MAG: CPBP family glutamic-type intramembrane protease [Planctomycetota bacterium]